MPRRPRLEFPGAIYHVSNRSDGRTRMFASTAAAQAFVDCLFEIADRTGWRVAAYCLLPNEYHLAVETPRGNLVDGVHWLQSTFGNRRRGSGRPEFRARYDTAHIEPGKALAELVDFVHLAPVRAGVVTEAQLAQFRWSSLRHYLRLPAERPGCVAAQLWLGARGLADSPDDWTKYLLQLKSAGGERSAAASGRRRRALNEWIRGSAPFRAAILARHAAATAARAAHDSGRLEQREREWNRLLMEACGCLDCATDSAIDAPKGAPWKIAVATWMRSRSDVTNRWLAERLHMGGPDPVSRYVTECQRGERREAADLAAKLERAG